MAAMSHYCCVILTSLFFVHCSTAHSLLYTSVSPSEIRPFSSYQIIVTLEKSPSSSPVKFLFTISSATNNTEIASADKRISPKRQTSVYLDIPDLKASEYILKVKAFPPGDAYPFERNSTLRSSFVNSTVLIQTDKPIYKPSDTVKYRVLILDRYFRPFESPANFTLLIRDPAGNIIHSAVNTKIPPKKTFLSQELKLSSEPIQGDWKIDVFLHEGPQSNSNCPCDTLTNFYENPSKTSSPNGQYKQSLSFTVEEYVLPKFKVDLKLSPSFVTFKSPKITAQVSPKYTFGSPVHGKCTLVLKHLSTTRQIAKTKTVLEGSTTEFVEFDAKSELGIKENEVTQTSRPLLSIDASCEDAISKKIYNESIQFYMYKYPYHIELIREGSRTHLKRGVSNTVKIRVTTATGEEPVRNAVSVQVRNVNSGKSTRLELEVGETSYTFPVPSKSDKEVLLVKYEDLEERFELQTSPKSSTGSYLKLSLDENPSNAPTEGKHIHLSAEATFSFSALNLVAMSKGGLAYSNYVTFNASEKSHQFQVRLPNRVPPSVILVAYTVDPATEKVVSDRISFSVEQTERVEVKLSVSTPKAEPGENVTITVKGLPNSVFGLRAVDESVLLLKKDNDLTKSRLPAAAERFDITSDDWELEDNNARKDLLVAGITLIGNGELEHKRRSREEAIKKPQVTAKSDTGEQSVSINRTANEIDELPRAPPRLRKYFPETWIWEEVESTDGQFIMQKTIPDSITSWSISAFQLNAQRGIGFTPSPVSLPVMRPFFVSLNLPYSIVKGESLSLQIIVHNYLPEPSIANVTLHNTDGFFRFRELQTPHASYTKQIELKASSVSSVSFLISPLRFGTMEVKVTATCESAGDSISVPLMVKPPGIKYVRTDSVLIDLEKPDFSHTLTPVFPKTRVVGADSVKINVVGDILGGTMENLENLIKLPSGCGEQNMLHFVPDIVILDYLKATGTVNPEVKRKAIEFLITGYQRELKFHRSDGSFSAFGSSDSVGSTWLTAFVVRSFLKAKRHITIDEKVIKDSLEFLINNQKSDGSFYENGRVIHKELQGSSDQNSIALTAFVLLAFQAAKENGFKKLPDYSATSTYIDKGVEFIRRRTSTEQLSTYGNALALHLLSEMKLWHEKEYLGYVEEAAISNSTMGLKYWDAAFNEKPSDNTKPSSIETTAYVLLSYVRQGKLAESLDVIRWLLRQRNSNGGFISTQDTVVGISALAKFAEAMKAQNGSEVAMSIGVYSIGNNDADSIENEVFGQNEIDYDSPVDENSPAVPPAHTFYIGKDNVTTTQEFILPINATQIRLNAEGKGTTLAQLTWSYFVDAHAPGSDLKLNITALSINGGEGSDIRVCSKVIKGEPVDMAIIEISALSGYEFDEDSLDTLKSDGVFDLFELVQNEKNSRANLYLPIDKTEKCFALIAHRANVVEDLARASAQVYDFYDPTRVTQILYSLDK